MESWESWESVYKKKGLFFHCPHEEMKKLTRLMKKNKIRKILDLGCGSGRHIIFLAKNNFEVYGMDNSKSGLKHTKLLLNKLDLKAKIKRGNCFRKFPYKDRFFDAVISIQVIHHARIVDIKRCVSEIKRVLRPNGIIFITVPKNKKNKFRSRIKMIDARTFIPLEGHEIGVPHYHFTKRLLKEYFRDFKIIFLKTDKNMHHCLLGMRSAD